MTVFWVKFVCLDFHHIDPSKKEGNIAKIITSISRKFLLSELEKCIVLCTNCHRKVHYNEKHL